MTNKQLGKYLQGTLEILDDVHAEPDELFKIGIVISRLENAIELLEEGGRGKQKVGVVDGASSNEEPS